MVNVFQDDTENAKHISGLTQNRSTFFRAIHADLGVHKNAGLNVLFIFYFTHLKNFRKMPGLVNKTCIAIKV